MEKAGFIVTVLAGFLTAFLLAWQSYQGPAADWVSGFLCVMWSLLMLARLTILTAPPVMKDDTPRLAQKLIRTLQLKQVEQRNEILHKSFGNSFAIFLILGFVFVGWQIFCAAFSANHYRMDGVAGAVQAFFAAGGATPLLAQARIFDWGQGFLFLLCLSMMGFMLRSYAQEKGFTRIALLILAGYVAAGAILFTGLPAAVNAAPLLDAIIFENGVLGVTLLSFIVFVPLGFIWLSMQLRNRDWIVISSGTIAGAGLVGGAFLLVTPALIGFFVLCWMGLFLAWGASENRLLDNPA